MQPATATCRAADQARLWPQRSCSKKISALLSMAGQWLGHDTDIRNARLFYCVYHCGEGSEGNVFVGADKNWLMLRISNLGAQLARDFIDVDGIVAHENALLLINTEDHTFLGDFFHGAGLRDVNLDPRLQDRRGDHEDDQQHQDHIDQGSDVDLG